MASPYFVGATLHVKSGTDDCVFKIQEILSHYRNFTVLKVTCEDVPEDSTCDKGQTAVLKLYDRRFAHRLRKQYNIPAHTTLLEQLYRQDVLENPPFSPTAVTYQKDEEEDTESEEETEMESVFDTKASSDTQEDLEVDTVTLAGTKEPKDEKIEDGYETDDTESCNPTDDDHEDVAADEENWSCRRLRHVQRLCQDLHAMEILNYEALRPVQGTRVPKFYGSVRLLASPETEIPEDSTHEVKELLGIWGILIEFIPGKRLWDSFPGTFTTHREEWENTLQTALDTVNRISICPMICVDAKPDNIIMRKTKGGDYEAVMFDFSYSTGVREWHYPDETWGLWKWNANEEGKVGRPIAQHFGLFFEESAAGTYRWSTYDRGIGLPPAVNPHLRPVACTSANNLANGWGWWAIALPSLVNPTRYPVIRGYDYNAEYPEDLNWEDFNWEDYDLPVEENLPEEEAPSLADPLEWWPELRDRMETWPGLGRLVEELDIPLKDLRRLVEDATRDKDQTKQSFHFPILPGRIEKGKFFLPFFANQIILILFLIFRNGV